MWEEIAVRVEVLVMAAIGAAYTFCHIFRTMTDKLFPKK